MAAAVPNVRSRLWAAISSS